MSVLSFLYISLLSLSVSSLICIVKKSHNFSNEGACFSEILLIDIIITVVVVLYLVIAILYHF